MAFTVVFPPSGEKLGAEMVANWLTERGEPFDWDTPSTLALRALPVRLVIGENDHIHAHLELTSEVSLSRMLEMLYALSVLAGADVRLLGVGEVTRSHLWLRLADEQDRLRISGAVERAEESGQREEVLHKLWPVIAAIREGCDDRWDARRGRIVELKRSVPRTVLALRKLHGMSITRPRGRLSDCRLRAQYAYTCVALVMRYLSRHRRSPVSRRKEH